jgi:hypothetical protein
MSIQVGSDRFISFIVHRLTGTWSYEIHKQKENPAEGWEKVGFLNPNFYTINEADNARIHKVLELTHEDSIHNSQAT